MVKFVSDTLKVLDVGSLRMLIKAYNYDNTFRGVHKMKKNDILTLIDNNNDRFRDFINSGRVPQILSQLKNKGSKDNKEKITLFKRELDKVVSNMSVSRESLPKEQMATSVNTLTKSLSAQPIRTSIIPSVARAVSMVEKKGRGRPRKNPPKEPSGMGRGRPRKDKEPKEKKPRGRPSKPPSFPNIQPSELTGTRSFGDFPSDSDFLRALSNAIKATKK